MGQILFEERDLKITGYPDKTYSISVAGNPFTINQKTLFKLAYTPRRGIEETLKEINPMLVPKIIESKYRPEDLGYALCQVALQVQEENYLDIIDLVERDNFLGIEEKVIRCCPERHKF